MALERGALEHAEAVLLVDHGEAEARKRDPLLDEGVRPDGEGDRAGGEARERPPARHPLHRAGEQHRLHPERLRQRTHGLEVLLGQQLGRRH